MKKYYVNNNTDTNPNNDHEVHADDCHLLPLSNGTDLGYHYNCQSAITEAKKHYSKVDGCVHCARECHHG
ncbi:MAG: hypothetical protein ABJH72_04340 [Reichenbachiella sp.]|uniref:hypothetical protein n=1 Tax=Reichenbachiella sp. TaxID=2184521 RepID=UPI0032993AEB